MRGLGRLAAVHVACCLGDGSPHVSHRGTNSRAHGGIQACDPPAVSEDVFPRVGEQYLPQPLYQDRVRSARSGGFPTHSRSVPRSSDEGGLPQQEICGQGELLRQYSVGGPRLRGAREHQLAIVVSPGIAELLLVLTSPGNRAGSCSRSTKHRFWLQDSRPNRQSRIRYD